MIECKPWDDLTNRFVECYQTLSSAEEKKIFSELIEKIDKKKYAEIQNKYLEFKEYFEQVPASQWKYLDICHWIKIRIPQVLAWGINKMEPQRGLDIGAGACDYPFIFEHFGHKIKAIDIDKDLYLDAASLFNIEHAHVIVKAKTPLPNFGEKFSFITALGVTFDNLPTVDGVRQYWGIEDWKFFIQDLINNQLSFPSKLILRLNLQHDHKNDSWIYDKDLLSLANYHNASVDERNGTMIFSFEKSIVI